MHLFFQSTCLIIFLRDVHSFTLPKIDEEEQLIKMSFAKREIDAQQEIVALRHIIKSRFIILKNNTKRDFANSIQIIFKIVNIKNSALLHILQLILGLNYFIFFAKMKNFISLNIKPYFVRLKLIIITKKISVCMLITIKIIEGLLINSNMIQ